MTDDENDVESGSDLRRKARRDAIIDNFVAERQGVLKRLGDGVAAAATLNREESNDLLANHQADPGLTDDLTDLAGDTTDDLGPIR